MRMPTILKILLGNRKAACGLAIVVAFVLMAIFAPILASNEPTKRVARPHQPPSAEFVMGSTRMGHDIWAQFTNGARVSLLVGFSAGILVCTLAVAIGITAGYFGGMIDECLTFLMNVVLVIPNLPLLLVLASFIGEASPTVIAVIIGLTSWAYGARVIRAQTLALREKEFVIAAEVLGEPAWRIILVEILPKLISIIGVSFIGSIIYAIVTEATLEFLGLGDPTVVSWGIMLYNAQTSSAILIGAWWEILAPCFAIATLGAGLALLNFAIDEIANPQLRSHKGLNRWKKLATPVATPLSAAQEKTA